MADNVTISVTGGNAVTITVTSTRGATGPAGPPGGSPPSQTVVTNGIAGTAPIPVVGYSDPSQYQVFLTWVGDPGGNGNLRAVKSAASFIITHPGVNFVECAYAVFPTT